MKAISNLHLDYLLEIFQASHIETNGVNQYVSSADLAQRLFTNQSSVNRIIDRLNTLQLVEYKPYIGVMLNDAGLETAIQLFRKQSIIESFLIHTLEIEWHKVCSEARQLLHHISPLILNRMWELTGKQPRSPFGEWIDTPQNTSHQGILLVNGDASQHYMIDRILTREQDRLQYLFALGLLPGVCFQLLHKAPFDGPIQIQLDREYRILAHDLSRMMTVVPYDR